MGVTQIAGMILLSIFLVNFGVAIAVGKGLGIERISPTDDYLPDEPPTPPENGGTPPSNDTENLMVNPSVEDDADQDGVPDYWSSYQTSEMHATLSWSDDFRTGQKSLQITVTHNPSGDQYESALWCQYINGFIVDETYRFRVWYKSTCQSALILITWDETDQKSVARLDLPASASWIQSEWVQLTIPTGTTTFRADARIFNNEVNGWAVFDDFELSETDATGLSVFGITMGRYRINLFWIVSIIVATILIVIPVEIKTNPCLKGKRK